MPPNRVEQEHRAEDKLARDPKAGAAAESAAEAAQPPKTGGGWKSWLPLAISLVAMPLVAYGVTTFVLVPRLQISLGLAGIPQSQPAQPAKSAESGSGEEKDSGGDRQTIVLNKLLVNVSGTMGSSYLLTSVTLVGSSSDFSKRVTESEPQLRDMACGLLSSKTIADLEKPTARNMIRGELLAGFNSILGSGTVQEIYFTEFAIQ